MKEAILKAIKNTGSTQQKKQAFHEIPKIMSELHIDLTNNQYQTGIFSCFVVRDPKLREIFAPSYRDRIVHHLIIDHIAPHIDKTFLSSSCANRKAFLSQTSTKICQKSK